MLKLFHERYLRFRRAAIAEIIAAGHTDGSIQATGTPEDLYDAVHGNLFHRSIFAIAPMTPEAARSMVELILRPKPR